MKQVCEHCKTCLNQCILCSGYYEGKDLWRVKVYHKNEGPNNVMDAVYHPAPHEPNLQQDMLLCTTCWMIYKKKEGETSIYFGGAK
jgi:hypothetical protein